MRHLEPSIKRAWNGHTFCGLAWAAKSFLKLLHGPLLLLKLLDQGVDGLFSPLLLFVTLLPAQETLNGWTGKGEERSDGGGGVHRCGCEVHRGTQSK